MSSIDVHEVWIATFNPRSHVVVGDHVQSGRTRENTMNASRAGLEGRYRRDVALLRLFRLRK